LRDQTKIKQPDRHRGRVRTATRSPISRRAIRRPGAAWSGADHRPPARYRHDATAAQLALAWLLQKSSVMLPIPGTSSIKHLEENMGTAKIDISRGDWKDIEAVAQRV